MNGEELSDHGVERQQVALRALRQRVAVLERVELRAVVAVYQMRELMGQQVVEHPVRKRCGAPSDPDRSVRKRAASPQVLHLGEPDRIPSKGAAKMARIELGRPVV